jgi:hypothetical protein
MNFSHETFGDPVLRGAPVLIPEIKLKATMRETTEIIPFEGVILRYVWKHYFLEYRKWYSAYDFITCTTNADGEVGFPEYSLVPRGWNDDSKFGKNPPEFFEIELSVKGYHFWITKDQIKKIRDKKVKKPIELKRPDGYVGPIKVEIIP